MASLPDVAQQFPNAKTLSTQLKDLFGSAQEMEMQLTFM